MEIGGRDVVFDRIGDRGRALETFAGTIRAAWPRAVFEDLETAERYDDPARIPYGRTTELAAFEDRDAALSWFDEEGDCLGRMITAFSEPDRLTVVIDDGDEPSRDVLAALRQALAGNEETR